MAAFYAKCGVTSFAPASMTLPYDVLEKAFATAKQLHAEAPEGLSRLMGIQMEGPYFSYKKRGAQNPDYLKDPDFEGFQKLYEGCGGLIRIVDVAPELPGAAEFVAKAKDLCTVSIAHTDSDYHIHPAAVRLAFTMFRDRMVLISDSGRCAGEPEGTRFQLGGQDAWLRGGVAKLADGTIACSATNLWTCLQNVLKWNVPEEEAVRAATFNPAKAIGAADKVGTIETGKLADFVVTNGDYTRKRVFIDGKEI